MNEIISFSAVLFLVYRNTTVFCILIFVSCNFTEFYWISSINSGRFWMDPLGFSIYKIMSSVCRDYFFLSYMKLKVAQSCPTLCNPMDCTVLGILQPRILEWVAVPFSRGSSQPRDWTQVSTLQADSLPAEPPGTPIPTWMPFFSFSCLIAQNGLVKTPINSCFLWY